MRIETERKMKRWREQRWILDQVIQTRGIDWDQGRTGKIIRNCGPGVEKDLTEVCSRIKKFVDIPREFSQRRRAPRRTRARRPKPPASSLTRAITTTSPLASTPMPCGRSTKTAIRSASHWQERKRASYDKFIQYAGRPIERVELPYDGKKDSGAVASAARAAKPARKCPASCTSPAWTASKKITRRAAIRSSSAASRCYPSTAPAMARPAKAASNAPRPTSRMPANWPRDYLVTAP